MKDFLKWFFPESQETLKHLQGQHDQAAHGRRGGAGPAEGGEKPGKGEPGFENFRKYSQEEIDRMEAKRRADAELPSTVAELSTMKIGDRLETWKKMGKMEDGIARQDAIANARHDIKVGVQGVLAENGVGKRPRYNGDIRSAIEKRVDQGKDLMMPDNAAKIKTTLHELDDRLEAAGVDPKLRHKLAMDAADTLMAQENESLARQIGDHGINHIKGNIDMGVDIVHAHPGEDTPADEAAIYLTNIYHDTGYLTKPAKEFLDRGHERWAAQHFNAHVRPLVARALGHNRAGEIETAIRTHSESSVDWDNEPLMTAVRVADNLALFHSEKLPGLFRYVPENVRVLERLKSGEIDVAGAQTEIRSNISKNSSRFSPSVRRALERASTEVSALTPKMTLGMLAGTVRGMGWKSGALVIRLVKDLKMTALHKLMDLGQRQFAKFAETYGVDENQVKNSLSFTLTNNQGKPILVTEVIEEKESQKQATTWLRYDTLIQHLKELMGNAWES